MIVINAILESFRSLKDKTLKLSFETNEPTPEQLNQIAVNSQKYGYLVFSGNQLTPEQLESIDKAKNDLYDSSKSPSKRLRSVLYVWFEKDNKGFKTFEDFYLHQMERVINNVKEKLD
jgi:uncharacterized protein YeaO (DUF488 family)